MMLIVVWVAFRMELDMVCTDDDIGFYFAYALLFFCVGNTKQYYAELCRIYLLIKLWNYVNLVLSLVLSLVSYSHRFVLPFLHRLTVYARAMTTSQTRIVAIYEVLSILCFITWFFYFFGDSLLKTLTSFGLLSRKRENEQPDDPDNPPTRFRDTYGHLYVPHIVPRGLTHAIYCVDITCVPPRHIPAHDGIDDLGALCVAKMENFPHLQQNGLIKMTDFFGQIYFNNGKELSGRIDRLSCNIDGFDTDINASESSNKKLLRACGTSRMNRRSAFKVVDDRPLPPGWEMSRTAEDVVFYVDHINKMTQTNFPTANQIAASPATSMILADGKIFF